MATSRASLIASQNKMMCICIPSCVVFVLSTNKIGPYMSEVWFWMHARTDTKIETKSIIPPHFELSPTGANKCLITCQILFCQVQYIDLFRYFECLSVWPLACSPNHSADRSENSADWRHRPCDGQATKFYEVDISQKVDQSQISKIFNFHWIDLKF